MGICVFKTADLKRCGKHAAKCKKFSMPPYVTEPPAPGLLFVHDQGVYLMSNGHPQDTVTDAEKDEVSYAVFAKDCDPKKDERWWENSRELVGGDDFAEFIPINDEWLEHCATYIEFHIKVTPTEIEAYFAKPRALIKIKKTEAT